jgi:hypothetical protein
VLSALLADQVGRLVDEAAGRSLSDALTAAALSLSDNPLLQALAQREPGTVAALARVDAGAEGWRRARDAVRTAVAAADRGGAELVLRWLASHVVTPSEPATVAADVEVLIAGLPVLPTPADERAESA